MDPTVQVALIGIITTGISGAVLVIVAVLNNKKERVGTAEVGVSETMEQRILLKDEQIELRDEQLALKDELIAARDQIIASQLQEMKHKDAIIERLMNDDK